MNKLLTIAGLILSLLYLISQPIWAIGTEAGTQIKNQASATYQVEGVSGDLTSTSNEVVTVVDPIHNFTITPTTIQYQTSVPGNTVYFPYNVINQGNTAENITLTLADTGTDALPSRTIYHDVNGNGIVDAGDPVIPLSGTGPWTGALGSIDADTVYHLIVSYQVPTTATTQQYESTPSASNGTTVVTGGENQTKVIAGAVITGNMSVSPNQVPSGGTTSYTIKGSNASIYDAYGATVTGAPAPSIGILVKNQLPAEFDLTAAAGDVTVSGPTGSVAVYSADGVTWTTTHSTTTAWIGLFMPRQGAAQDDPVLLAGQTYQLDYKVVVTGTEGAVINDSAQISYYAAKPSTTPALTTVDTNTTTVTVTTPPVPGTVLVGSDADITVDLQTIATAPAGSTQTFTQTIRNTGSTADAFNLTAAIGTFPVGTQFLFYYPDGVTPLPDSDNNTIPDITVPSNPASNPTLDRKFVVKILIPNNAPNTANATTTITATSANFLGKADTTQDRITSIVAVAGLIRNWNGDTTTPTYNTNDNDGTLVPGTTNQKYYPLGVTNSGAGTDTFSLSATLNAGLPVGTVVAFYETLTNGQPDLTKPISGVTVAGGATYNLVAVVTWPLNSPPQSTNNSVTYAVASITNPAAVITPQADHVVIPPIDGVTLAPNRNGTGVPGGTVIFTHLLTNLGNRQDTYTLLLTTPLGWTYLLYDGSDVLLPNQTSITVNAGTATTIKIRGFIPANAPTGTTDNMNLKATSTNDGTKTAQITDTTVVIAGVLQLVKQVEKWNGSAWVSGANAAPGDRLRYSLDYKNLATKGLTTLKIVDALPIQTTYDLYTVPTVPIVGNTITVEWSTDGVSYSNDFVSAPFTKAGVKFLRWTFNLIGPNTLVVNPGYDSSVSSTTIRFEVLIK